MPTRKMGTEHEEIILELAALGQSTRQIAESVLKRTGLKVSHVAVANFLARSKESRADSAKSVVREKLAASLTRDQDVLDKRLTDLGKVVGAARKAKDWRYYFQAIDREKAIIELRARLSGADTPDTAPDPTAKAEKVLERLKELLEGK